MSVADSPAQPERQRTPALVLPRALLLELARHARHRPTCDRHPLAAGALVAAPARRAETQAGRPRIDPRATGSDPSDGSREPTLGQHAHPRRAPTPRLRAEQLDRPALPGVSRRSRPTALVDVLPEPRAVSRRGAARGDDRQLAPHGYLDRFTAATEGLGAQASEEDRDALRASGLGHVSRILAALGSTEAGDGGLAGACTRRPNGPAEGRLTRGWNIGAPRATIDSLPPHGYLDRFTAATEGLGAQASDEDRDALRASGLGHVSRILAALGSTEAGDGGLAGACTRRPWGANIPSASRMRPCRAPTIAGGPECDSAFRHASICSWRTSRSATS